MTEELIEYIQFSLSKFNSNSSFGHCLKRYYRHYQNWSTTQMNSLVSVPFVKSICTPTPPAIHQDSNDKFGIMQIDPDEAMWFRASFFDYLGVPPSHCFCTRVRGDSMHPTLIDRSTVLWKMQNGYTREGIYLFRQVDELRIKRLQRTSRNVFRIISDNSNKDIYPVETLDLAELGEYDFEIYGFYLWDCGIKE